MYGWVKPRIAMPMHGEARHLAEHAKLARAAGVNEVLDVRNGDMVRAGAGAGGDRSTRRRWAVCSATATCWCRAAMGRCASGARWRSPASSSFRSCCRAGARSWPTPEIMLDGVPTADAKGRPMLDIVLGAVDGTIDSIPRDRRRDGEMVREAVRRAVRSAVENAWGKRPIAKVLLTRTAR